MYDEVVIPWIGLLKVTYGIPEGHTFYLMDGEAPQIGPFRENAYCDKFRDLKISVCKPAGSTTEITQCLFQISFPASF